MSIKTTEKSPRRPTGTPICLIVVLALSCRPVDAEAPTAKPIRSWATPHRVTSVAISPSGEIVVATGPHGVISIWETQSGKFLRHAVGTSDDATSSAIDPAGRHFAVTGIEGSMRVFRIDNGQQVYERGEHGSRLMRSGFSPDGKLVASSCWDGMVRWFDAASGTPKGQAPCLTTGAGQFAFSPYSRSLFVPGTMENGSSAGGVVVVDLANAKVVENIPVPGDLWTIAISPDARLMAVGSGLGDVQVWDIQKKEAVATWKIGESDRPVGLGIVTLSFLGANEIVAMSMNGVGGVWSIEAKPEPVLTLRKPTDSFASLAVASTGLAALADWQNQIEIVDLKQR